MVKLTSPIVSVVITSYNYGKYLSNAIKSVLDQTFQDFELIIVNDGSTDNTAQVVRAYLRDPRICYIEQLNSGQTAAKNVGISKARGELIAFLDADDGWERTKLAEQISLFSDLCVGVVYSRATWIDEKGTEAHFNRTPRYLIPRSGNVTKYLIYDNFVIFSSSVIRKECIDKLGAFDPILKMGIDWDLWLRISVHYKFEFVNKPLVRCRFGHVGQMSKNQEGRLQSAVFIMKGFFERNPRLLTDFVVRGAWAYTYSNRGKYYQKSDLRLSTQYYFRSIKNRVFQLSAYKGLVRNMLYCIYFKLKQNI